MSGSSAMTRIMQALHASGKASSVPAERSSAIADASLALHEFRGLLRESPPEGEAVPNPAIEEHARKNDCNSRTSIRHPDFESAEELAPPADFPELDGLIGRPHRELARALMRNVLLPRRPVILFCGDPEAQHTAAGTAMVLSSAVRRRVLMIDASEGIEKWIPACAALTAPASAASRPNLCRMTSGVRSEAKSNVFERLKHWMSFRRGTAFGDRPDTRQVRKGLFSIKTEFDIILIAAPPVMTYDFEALGAACDAAVQVVRTGSSARAARTTADAIRRLGIMPAGCVVING